MKIKTVFLFVFMLLVLLLDGTPVWGHEIFTEQPLIIDTDMGLDDAVTLALALQNPKIRIKAIVSTEGVCSGSKSTDYLSQLLWEFNRTDLMLYKPAVNSQPKGAPPFRCFAENALKNICSSTAANNLRQNTFSPKAYVVNASNTNILALGPLTNIAAALKADPEIKYKIGKIIIAGWPDVNKNWNLNYDRTAYKTVLQSGIQLVFVVADNQTSAKLATWCNKHCNPDQNTAIGEFFFRRLMTKDDVREHYVTRLGFHDELAFLFLDNPSLFKGSDNNQNVYVPSDASRTTEHFTVLLTQGRQGKERVVFLNHPFPTAILQSDVADRMECMIAKNGKTEWFAQVIMNELHEHLGAYSIIGVKMGLFAMERLNAPQHSMKVVSHVAVTPPASCLNDGIIVATGCTPGRVLFSQGQVDLNCARATFTYNDRTITLELKSEYRDKIQQKIKALRSCYALEDHYYWSNVRTMGLDIWENWHRNDLFNTIPTEHNELVTKN